MACHRGPEDPCGDEGREVLNMAEWLESQNRMLEKRGRVLGRKLAGRIPVVYSSSGWWQVARIWKIKFNENSKTPSFWNVFPELNHNEMIGFTNPLAPFSFIFLQDPADHARVKKRMGVMRGLMERKGLPVHEVEMTGRSVLEKMFSTLVLGDWASYHAALESGADPVPVEMVEEFKKKIGESKE